LIMLKDYKSYIIFLSGILLISWVIFFVYCFIDSFFFYNLKNLILYFSLSCLTLAINILIFKKQKHVLHDLMSSWVISGVILSILGGYGYLFLTGKIKYYWEFTSFSAGYKTQPFLAYLSLFSCILYFIVIGILGGISLQYIYKKYFSKS